MSGLHGHLEIACARGLALLVALAAPSPGHAQLLKPDHIVTYHSPLERAADSLGQPYGVQVTYENPVQISPVELGVRRQPNGIEGPALRERSLALPTDLTPEKTPRLDAALLSEIVEAYGLQNPGQPRYQVLESKLGLHIVPLQADDESGKLAPAASLLDARISVPVAKRRASEQLKALCDAVSAATGSTVRSGAFYIDDTFAANGYLLPRDLTNEERQYLLFEWGTSGTTAREALIDLLDRSATTRTWAIVPGPVGQRTGPLPQNPSASGRTGEEIDDVGPMHELSPPPNQVLRSKRLAPAAPKSAAGPEWKVRRGGSASALPVPIAESMPAARR